VKPKSTFNKGRLRGNAQGGRPQRSDWSRWTPGDTLKMGRPRRFTFLHRRVIRPGSPVLLRTGNLVSGDNDVRQLVRALDLPGSEPGSGWYYSLKPHAWRSLPDTRWVYPGARRIHRSRGTGTIVAARSGPNMDICNLRASEDFLDGDWLLPRRRIGPRQTGPAMPRTIQRGARGRKIDTLREGRINHHNHLYYVLGQNPS